MGDFYQTESFSNAPQTQQKNVAGRTAAGVLRDASHSARAPLPYSELKRKALKQILKQLKKSDT
jgi:hypothetical protein